MDQQETVSQLFALRSGLSLISENTDMIKAAQQSITDAESRVETDKDRLQQLESNKSRLVYRISTNEGEISRNNNEISALRKEIDEHYTPNDLKNRLKHKAEYIANKVGGNEIDYFKYRIFAILLFIVFGGALYGAMACFATPGIAGNGGLLILVAVPAFVAGVVNLCIFIYKYKKCKAFIKNDFEREVRDKTKKIYEKEKTVERLKSEIAENENYISVTEEGISAAERKLTDSYEYQAELNAQKNAEIAELSHKSFAIFEALKKTYAFISDSDWQNIDLIIFYLQTGRADNIKEALLLADRQRQTDSIVQAISEASNNVCRTIKSGMYALASVMTKQFEGLSAQITGSADMLSGALKAQNALIDKQIEQQNRSLSASIVQTERLISAVELNNALQSKANETSDRLVNDLWNNQRYWNK